MKALCVLPLLLVALIGCSKPGDDLHGSWSDNSGSGLVTTVTFNPDNTMTFVMSGGIDMSASGTYSVPAKGQLVTTTTDVQLAPLPPQILSMMSAQEKKEYEESTKLPPEGKVSNGTYTINGDVLTITEEGESMNFVRQK